jgi:hypothetical protein
MILDIIKDYSVEQLNTIPAGFSNNIIWNLGHMIASQQGICYKRAGLDTRISELFFNTYKPGTKPQGFVDASGVEEIKQLLFTTLEQLETDYAAGIFSNYGAFVTRYGVELTNIDDALGFIPFHEGLHIGYIMSLRKLV